ncbi:DoxX family protein [Streptomyces sp. NPDC059193]|uniref:DoxX family protein n=1 Tax=Streptomyces sp. NPDC059193 TaxID=3346763 RepID=UPI00369A0A12
MVHIASATFTLQRNDQIVASMRKVQVPDSWLPRLATLKAAGAVGLVAGLWFTPLGIAAGRRRDPLLHRGGHQPPPGQGLRARTGRRPRRGGRGGPGPGGRWGKKKKSLRRKLCC